MKLSAIKGQNRVVDALKRSISVNRVAHAYLFEGPDGCGRRSTARALIQALFCKEPVNGDACNICSSCIKLLSGNHPDLNLLQPLPDKRDITIEQVRELQQILSLRPFESIRKGCIIEPAERMNEKSSNALLKTLEEPPGNAIIILLANQADRLLSTIRSRCQHLRFSPLGTDVVKEILLEHGADQSKAAKLASLSEGSMERALSLDGESDLSDRERLLSFMTKISSARIGTVFDQSESLASGREEALQSFKLIISMLRDMMIIRSSASQDISNSFLYQELAAEAARFTQSSILEIVELAIGVRNAVQGNANPKLAIEHFMIGYAGLRKGV